MGLNHLTNLNYWQLPTAHVLSTIAIPATAARFGIQSPRARRWASGRKAIGAVAEEQVRARLLLVVLAIEKLRSTLPVLAPRCEARMPAGSACEITAAVASTSSGGRRPCRRVTGMLFGRCKDYFALALKETPLGPCACRA
jgi:hypothetical protein